MKNFNAQLQEYENRLEWERSRRDEAAEVEIHHCNNCDRAVIIENDIDLYLSSGLCKFCRDEVCQEMYESSLEGQLEKICHQLDEILGQTKQINKTLRGEK